MPTFFILVAHAGIDLMTRRPDFVEPVSYQSPFQMRRIDRSCGRDVFVECHGKHCLHLAPSKKLPFASQHSCGCTWRARRKCDEQLSEISCHLEL